MKLYQIWVEKGPARWSLEGEYNTLYEATQDLQDYRGGNQTPILTKVVTWTTVVTDISEVKNSANPTNATKGDE